MAAPSGPSALATAALNFTEEEWFEQDLMALETIYRYSEDERVKSEALGHAWDLLIEKGECCYDDVGFPGSTTGGGRSSPASNLQQNGIRGMIAQMKKCADSEEKKALLLVLYDSYAEKTAEDKMQFIDEVSEWVDNIEDAHPTPAKWLRKYCTQLQEATQQLGQVHRKKSICRAYVIQKSICPRSPRTSST